MVFQVENGGVSRKKLLSWICIGKARTPEQFMPSGKRLNRC